MLAKGRALFQAHQCGRCHILRDAGAVGRLGPPLDSAPNLTVDLVVERVTNGAGPMPDFSEKLDDSEIAAIAAYVTAAAVR